VTGFSLPSQRYNIIIIVCKGFQKIFNQVVGRICGISGKIFVPQMIADFSADQREDLFSRG
jgi:hypothetical protein